eukprot:m.7802 g.7802  ORF g.7802 m.7802 type:complete len:384 (+) comp19665_c0_seq2:13-1164(+)
MMLRLFTRIPSAQRFSVCFGGRFFSNGSSAAAFASAQEKLQTLTKEPNNETKLKLYAYFKQATIGRCTTKKPGMLDFVAKAKWDAWTELGDMPKEKAEGEYGSLVGKLLEKDPGAVNSPGAAASPSNENDDLVMATKDGVFSIAINRPTKLNALTLQMYRDITAAIERAGSDDSTRVCTVTANGDYYSSGNDLNNFAQIPPEGVQKMAEEGGEILRTFVDSFIKFPKPLVAIVNGPALGIMVTTLGLFDLVYASDKAVFHTPFAETAQTPEGCSSFLFPRIMGLSKANEVLLLSRKLTATEAMERNLVTAVFPHDRFREEADKHVQKLAASPPKATQASKRIIRNNMIPALLEVNRRECEVLVEQWMSDEFVQAMMKFFQRKK